MFRDTYRFSEALMNSGECRGKHSFGPRNDKLRRSGASGDVPWRLSLGNLHCRSYFNRKCGFKDIFFLLLVAKDRESLVVGAKNTVVGRVTHVVAKHSAF